MIKLTIQAAEDIDAFRQTASPAAKRKLAALFDELLKHPKEGTGKPKALQRDFKGYWSRRINSKERIVYQIDENEGLVTIIAVGGHYGDK